MKNIFLILTALFLGPLALEGQSCNVTNTASCSVPVGASVTVSSVYRLDLGTPNSAAGTIALADMNVGYKDIPSGQLPSISVLTNQSWRVQVSTPATWTGTGLYAWTSKPASDLRWGLSPGGITNAMTVTPATIASGNRTQSTIVPVYYRILLNWANDSPGSYTIMVTYTLLSP